MKANTKTTTPLKWSYWICFAMAMLSLAGLTILIPITIKIGTNMFSDHITPENNNTVSLAFYITLTWSLGVLLYGIKMWISCCEKKQQINDRQELE